MRHERLRKGRARTQLLTFLPLFSQKPHAMRAKQFPAASDPEQHIREPQAGVQPVRDEVGLVEVGLVVEVGAPMERTDGQDPTRLARLSDGVHNRGACHVANAVASRAKPAAQVRILPVQKVALVETARVLQCVPPWPIRAVTSYGPRRVPGLRDMVAGAEGLYAQPLACPNKQGFPLEPRQWCR